MSSVVHHRDLLLCVLAREQGLLDDLQLQHAVDRWLQHKEGSLVDAIAADGLLTEEQLVQLRMAADARAAETCLDPVASHLRSLPRPVRAMLESASSQLPGDFATSPSGSTGGAGSNVTPIELDASDRFSIVQLHAQGGLGVIFQARDEEVDRIVALKQIKNQWADDNEARTRFLLEAKITGRLEHPGIVPIYALGADQTGRPYYAMRLIRGESLLQVLQRFHKTLETVAVGKAQRNVQLRKLLDRFIDLCNALEYAHSHGIVHRDVKPANVMLGKFGETLLVDWGLAKVIGADEEAPPTSHLAWTPLPDADSTSTRAGSAVGTPAYMSPEQATGQLEAIGPPSDVYNLGATLYQVLTGLPPHGEETDLGVLLAKIEQGRLTPPDQRAPWLPKPLVSICLRAMQPRAEHRYRSARALADDLESWLADEPVDAHHESHFERVGRWMRNHRSLVMAIAAAHFVAAVAIVVGLIGWNHFQSRRIEDQMAIRQQQQQRLTEISAAASSARQSAAAELRAGRYSSARTFLDTAVAALNDEPSLAAELQAAQTQQQRVAQLVDYYRLSRAAEEEIAFQNDTAARRRLLAGLNRIGVFDHGDWWAHLPTVDLTARQADALREHVYRQLIYLAANYAKGAFGNLLAPEGKTAAENTLAAAERVQRFRPTSSTRWHASCARFRLARGVPLRVSQLAEPRRAADAYMLGALAVVASQNPAVASFFTTEPDRLSDLASSYLQLASTLDPEYYWTLFVLGYAEMTAAGEPTETPPEISRPHYENARRAFSHCIAIDPDYWLAYAERCNSYRQEIEARRAAGVADQPLGGQTTEQLRVLMLRDLEKLRNLAGNRTPAQWYIGFALYTAGQTEAAVDTMLANIDAGARFDVDRDVRMLDPEAQRALPEVVQIADQLLADAPQTASYELLRAGAFLRLQQLDAAAASLEKAFADAEPHPMALVMRGGLRLLRRDFRGAEADLRAALVQSPERTSALIGLGRALEAQHRFDEALQIYDDAATRAMTAYQIAAIQLGRSRTLLASGQTEAALDAVKEARQAEASCEVESLLRVATNRDDQEFLGRLEALVAEPSLAARDAENPPQYASLPVLNGDFELPLGDHWHNLRDGDRAWHNHEGAQSTGRVTSDTQRGSQVLHLSYPPSVDVPVGFGVTSQTAPADPAGRYRLTVACKSRNLASDAVRIVVNDRRDEPVIALPPGTYDWRELAGEFSIDGGQSQLVEGLAAVKIEIQIAAPGEAWLDDLRIETVEP